MSPKSPWSNPPSASEITDSQNTIPENRIKEKQKLLTDFTTEVVDVAANHGIVCEIDRNTHLAYPITSIHILSIIPNADVVNQAKNAKKDEETNPEIIAIHNFIANVKEEIQKFNEEHDYTLTFATDEKISVRQQIDIILK